MIPIDESVRNRMAKLHRMAADVSSPEEASNAARMLATYMRKYQIEHIDTVLQDLKHEDNMSYFDSEGSILKTPAWHKRKEVPLWATGLGIACAKLFDCEVRLANNEVIGRCLRFYGYKADLELCAWTYAYLMDQIRRFSLRYAKLNKDGRARTDYRLGIVSALRKALQDLKEERDLFEKGASSSTALVVAKDNAIREKFGTFKYSVTRVRESEARREGYRDGQAIKVNPGRPVGNSAPNKQLN